MPLLSWAENTIPPEWQLSASEMREIKAGNIVSHYRPLLENVHSIEAFLLIKASPAHVFSILIDFEKLPEYAPHVTGVQVLLESDKDALVNFMLSLPFGVEKRYRLHLDYEIKDRNIKMSWQSVPWLEVKPEESIVSTSGYWYLIAGDDSKTTWVVYKTTTDSGDVPFGLGWIVNHMSTVTVLELLRKTKERAE